MSFDVGKFFRMFAIVLLVGILAIAAMERFSDWSFFGSEETQAPASLVAQAQEALEAVRNRTPSDRRPALFDSVLTPLDKLLSQAKDLVGNLEYDPIRDYQKLYDLTDPVIKIADEANQVASNQTGFWSRDYRFNEQKAEACQYLASGMWSRAQAKQAGSPSQRDESSRMPESEINAVLRIINMGLEANPENATLWYMRGIVNRANGLFAAAARDLEKALELNPHNADAMNVLGLVSINLKQFDKAEEYLEKAREEPLSQAKKTNMQLGEEYTTTLFNLARFHEGLAAYYARENRMSPSPENQRLLSKHAAEARKYFAEFLQREPPDTQDARTARRLMDGLPG